MYKQQELLKQYKPVIRPGKRSTEEMVTWLKSHCDVEEIPLTAFTDTFWKYETFNLQTVYPQMESDAFEFVAYRLLPSQKNAEYIQCLAGSGYSYGYVVLEKKTGSISCNAAKLFLEMKIEQGVDYYDYEHDTLTLLSYIHYMEFYKNKEY